VEGELFKVPKRPFIENPNSPFSNMFSLLLPGNLNTDTAIEGEGTSEENPIILEQVQKVEFERFLTVLLLNPPFRATNLFENMTIEEWISLLKLSTRWNFVALRKLATHYLSVKKGFTNIDRIVLAREYGVDFWFVEGILKSASSDTEISHFDAARLGLQTTMSLYHMKGAVRR
ncbi:hypothetical protein L218DRAFT_827212, partial [Marasmius fiardii PR-910]